MLRKVFAVSVVMAFVAIPLSIVAGMIPSPVPPQPPPIQSTYVYGPQETVYGVVMPEGWFKKFQIAHEWHYGYYMNCQTLSKHFVDKYANGQFVSVNDSLAETNMMDIISISSHHEWKNIFLGELRGSNYCDVTVIEKF